MIGKSAAPGIAPERSLADPQTPLARPIEQGYASRDSASVAVDPPHRHVHRWEGGERSFTHSHAWPPHGNHENATRPHRHSNGRHSHPHGHAEYAA